jgi:cyclophilin family peptidyl-prolyl cis-trans isomerase
MSYFVYSEYFQGQEAGGNGIDPINGGGTTNAKTIVFELKAAEAPNTCANFQKYVNDGFFDGLIFHRVIDGFMIQGGGFTPDLTQKSATYSPIALEISSLRHIDGAVAMARTNDPNSATSQFYICDGPQSSLDNNYAVFGQVTSGMDHVRAISAVSTHNEGGMDDVPVNDVVIKTARLSTSGGKTYVTLTVEY